MNKTFLFDLSANLNNYDLNQHSQTYVVAQGDVVVEHVATGGSLAAPGETLPVAAGSLFLLLFTLEAWRWMG